MLRSSILCASTLFLSALTINAQSQNQIREYSGTCFQCLAALGMACGTIPHAKCSKSGTNTTCGDALGDFTAKCTKTSGDKLEALRNPKLILANLQLDTGKTTDTSSTKFMFWPGYASDEVGIVSITHDAEHDLFSEGILKNQGSSSLASYKVGWLTFLRGNDQIQVAEVATATLKSELKPNDTVTVGPLGVSPKLLELKPQLIVFFIAEAEFTDGSRWSASIPEIEARYKNPTR